MSERNLCWERGPIRSVGSGAHLQPGDRLHCVKHRPRVEAREISSLVPVPRCFVSVVGPQGEGSHSRNCCLASLQETRLVLC